MTLGEKLKQSRVNAKLTQNDVANKLSTTSQAISRWENDSNEPDLETLKKLSSIYNVSITYLIDAVDKQEKKISKEDIENEDKKHTMKSCEASYFKIQCLLNELKTFKKLSKKQLDTLNMIKGEIEPIDQLAKCTSLISLKRSLDEYKVIDCRLSNLLYSIRHQQIKHKKLKKCLAFVLPPLLVVTIIITLLVILLS